MALELGQLTFRATPLQPGTPSTVTVLVGPNNSGKSLALREIAEWASGSDAPRQVVGDIDVTWPTDQDEAERLLRPFESPPEPGEHVSPDTFYVTPFNPRGEMGRHFVQLVPLGNQLSVKPSPPFVRTSLLQHFVAKLDGRTRFGLMDPRPWQDLQTQPQHHLAALFLDDTMRMRVRDYVSEAFPGRLVVIYTTGVGQFRVRLSNRPPSSEEEERNWNDDARAFHAAASPIESLSDGVVCFCGLIAAAVSLPHRVLLVDEPEAFLHPPLARLLGSGLASLTKERDGSLVAATHSAEFLMGCIESGADTTIVRLTYEHGTAGANVLSPTKLKDLIRDPLLRSTRALSGLFHRGVVVGESDHDRAFYDEINRRLTLVDRGAQDTFFTNAQNWSTIARVIGPLRQLGVPAAAILDLDTLTGNKGEWRRFYEAAGLTESEQRTLEAQRSAVASHLTSLGKGPRGLVCKSTGLRQLTPGDRNAARALISDLQDLGVFVVDRGELESWLPGLNIATNKKSEWIVQIFRALGTTPGAKAYVAPGAGDVWGFLDRVAAWIRDPGRRGMPAVS